MNDAFVLGSLVYATVKATQLTDPAQIAEEVLAQINEVDHKVALQQALRTMVRIEITRRRDLSLPTINPKITGKARSAAVRAAWVQRIDALERNAAGEWAHLGDFTRADLLAAAEFRRALAAQDLAKAEQYEQLAALMGRSNAKTLRSVSVRDLSAILVAAA